jgi:hypothetical protein
MRNIKLGDVGSWLNDDKRTGKWFNKQESYMLMCVLKTIKPRSQIVAPGLCTKT